MHGYNPLLRIQYSALKHFDTVTDLQLPLIKIDSAKGVELHIKAYDAIVFK